MSVYDANQSSLASSPRSEPANTRVLASHESPGFAYPTNRLYQYMPAQIPQSPQDQAGPLPPGPSSLNFASPDAAHPSGNQPVNGAAIASPNSWTSTKSPNVIPTAIPAEPKSVSTTLADETKRSRACDHCRALKVRCVPYEQRNPTGVCCRCHKSSRPCIFTVNPRKRHKRTDTRVADLEKKLDQLTAQIAASKEVEDYASTSSAPSPNNELLPQKPTGVQGDLTKSKAPATARAGTLTDVSYGDEASYSSISSLAELASMRPEELAAYARAHNVPSHLEVDEYHGCRFFQTRDVEEIMRRYDIPEEVRQETLDFFIKNMLPHLPFIHLVHGSKFSDLMVQRPMLSLSIVGLAMPNINKNLATSGQLMAEVYRLLSEQVLVVGNKTIDIVQCLLTICFWYSPAEAFECHRALLFANCASTIASDIGINRPPRPRRPLTDFSKRIRPRVDTESLECRRLWIGIYICLNTLALGFRTAEQIRWSSYLDRCCDILEAQNASPLDIKLCKSARLHQILCNIGDIIHPLDGNSCSLSDSKYVYMLKIFENSLIDWRASVGEEDLKDCALNVGYHTAQIYLHEVGLHNKANRGDFTVPYTEESISPENMKITPSQAEAIVWCIASCHGVIDSFCAGSSKELAYTPVHYSASVMYSCTILLKIALTVMNTNTLSPGFSLNMVRPDYYLGKSYKKLSEVCEENTTSFILVKFKHILSRLYLWFHKQKSVNNSSAPARGPPSSVNAVYRSMPELDTKLQNSFGAPSSTLDMLSSVAMQDQISQSMPGLNVLQDQEVFMPHSDLTVIQHIEQEVLQEQRQRASSNGGQFVMSGNTPLPLSSPYPVRDEAFPYEDGQANGNDMYDAGPELIEDDLWGDIFYSIDGQLPNVDMTWLNFQMPVY